MADKVVFDPQKLQSGSLVDCQEQQLLELAKKLCRIAAEECGENGFRGGIRPGNIYVAEDGRVKVGKAGKAGENGWTKLELECMQDSTAASFRLPRTQSRAPRNARMRSDEE